MGWMQKCIQTYDNNLHMVGVNKEGAATLSPVFFIAQKAQIEITLDRDGNFIDAKIIDKNDAVTLIPAPETPRTSGIQPLPLCDQLSYIAMGHPHYPDSEKYTTHFNSYIDLLSKWVDSPYNHFIPQAVLAYCKKGTIIHDLERFGIIETENGRLTNGKIDTYTYDKCLVRWRVLNEDEAGESWLNKNFYNKYRDFYLSLSADRSADLCYATGEESASAQGFPKGIIRFANGAKVISANDSSGFTYRGRFENAEQAFNLGSIASQKAHCALTWLAANQGISYSGRTFICWNPENAPVPELDMDDAWLFDEDAEEEQPTQALTEPEYKTKILNAVNGYRVNFTDTDNIVIMSLDAATTGRLSITYYNELFASDFLDRLENWHNTCNWYTFTKIGKNTVSIIRSPSIKDIVKAAFGTEQTLGLGVDDRIMKENSQRIIHCIVDAAPIPRDIVSAVTEKATMRQAYKQNYNYNKVLFAACSLIRKYRNDIAKINNNGKEVWTMTLDTANNDRSYLFGRLLAVAEYAERTAYSAEEINREPTAIRLQSAFAKHPWHTWKTIAESLNYYFKKMYPGTEYKCRKLIDDIFATLQDVSDDELRRPLKDTYLLGYYLQRKELYTKNTTKENDENGTQQ